MINIRDPRPEERQQLVIRDATPDEGALVFGIREPTEKENTEIQLDNATAGLGGVDAAVDLGTQMIQSTVAGLGSLPTLAKTTWEEGWDKGVEAAGKKQEEIADILPVYKAKTKGGRELVDLAHKAMGKVSEFAETATENILPGLSVGISSQALGEPITKERFKEHSDIWEREYPNIRATVDTLIQVAAYEAVGRALTKGIKGRNAKLLEEQARPKPLRQRLLELEYGEKAGLNKGGGADLITPSARKMIKDAAKYPVGKPKLTRYTKQEKAWYKKTHKPPKIDFKEPGVLSSPFTPMGFEMERLGLKPIMGKKLVAKKNLNVAVNKARKFHRDMQDWLYEIEGTTFKERAKAYAKNTPTKETQAMAEIINRFEEAPKDLLTPDEVKWFNRVREYTRGMWEKTNEVRARMGEDPIPYKEAYYRHVPNEIVKEMLRDRYPIPQHYEKFDNLWRKRKYFNPTELERKLGDELRDIWSKDIVRAMDDMAYYNLKYQYMSEPQLNFKEMMKMYEPYGKAGKEGMPLSTFKWAKEYNKFLDGHQSTFDGKVNNLVTKTFLKDYANFMLKPFGRRLGSRPISRASTGLGRITLSAVLGPRPKLILRNYFQKVQAMSFMPFKQWVKAFRSVNKEIESLIKEGPVYKDYSAFEDVAAGGMRKAEEMYHGAYQWSAKDNVYFAEKAAYHSAKELITNPKYANYGWASRERIDAGYPKDMKLTMEELRHIRDEMTEVAANSQYLYSPEEMPYIFKHKTLAAPLRLLSWPMNYFCRYQRSAINRWLTGRPTHGNNQLRLPPAWRRGHIKYIIAGGAILKAMGYNRSYFTGVLPDSLSPVPEMAIGLYEYVVADTDKQRAAADYKIKNAFSVMYPGALLMKDVGTLIEKGPMDAITYK